MKMEEHEYYKKFQNKKIRVAKQVGNRAFYYSGVVIAVFSDKLILNDIKLGEIPISFENMSVVKVGGGYNDI